MQRTDSYIQSIKCTDIDRLAFRYAMTMEELFIQDRKIEREREKMRKRKA